nr:hypothetical protein Iba_chr11bCG5830 [Ipomoea batatas]
MLQDVLPSPLVGGSREGLFTGLDSDVIGFRLTRLTPLPTTPRCVTPDAPFVWAVDAVGESKSPLLLTAATCEELIATDAELFSAPFAFAATIPRISWRIDVGLETSWLSSSSCKRKDEELHKTIKNLDTYERPVSVSISASLSWEESVDCNILDDSAAVLSDGTVWPEALSPCFVSKSAYSRDPTEGFDEFSPFSLFSESERPSVTTPASMVSRILSGEEPLPSEFTTSSAIDERRQRKPSR